MANPAIINENQPNIFILCIGLCEESFRRS